jgi:thiosulfate dehydrogenase
MSLFWGIWSALLTLFCFAVMIAVVVYYWRQRDDGNSEQVIDECDGIQERDAPPPKIIFYAYAVAFLIALVYLVFYPGFGQWPGLTRWTPEDRVLEHSQTLQEQIESVSSSNGLVTLSQLAENPDIVKAGESLYENHCIACHRTLGRGQKHYPALNDQTYLYGNNDADIIHSIVNGRHGVMAGWEDIMTPNEIRLVSLYTISLDKKRHVMASNSEKTSGKQIFQRNCTACHAIDGTGNVEQGIPDLKDLYWIHGGDLSNVKQAVTKGLSNIMPAFNHLREDEIYALGAYIRHVQKLESDRLTGLDPELIKKGQYLAHAGDCVACHLSHNGEPWGGGLPFITPFGTLYSTNISPHVEEGIGTYTFEDFDNAIRRGYNNDNILNRWLYPAMPFTSYTYLSEDDMKALWAWAQSLPPVSKPNRQNRMMFPANIRAGMMGWNFLFLDRGQLEYDESRSSVWKRGKYLVRGLGHCWECHTPRNLAQALIPKKVFQGSYIEGWNALNITANELREAGWTVKNMTDYLHTGQSEKGTPFGGMAEVVTHSLSKMSRKDVEAMAVYLLEGDEYNTLNEAIEVLKPEGFTAEAKRDPSYAVYQYTCAACHGEDGKGRAGIAPTLYGNGVIMHQSPFNTIAISLRGLKPDYRDEGKAYMPMSSFDYVINDTVIAKLMTFVRKYLGARDTVIDESDIIQVRYILKKDGYLNEVHALDDDGDD